MSKRGFNKTTGTGMHIESLNRSLSDANPMPFRRYGDAKAKSERREQELRCECASGLPLIARNPNIAAQGYCRKCKPKGFTA